MDGFIYRSHEFYIFTERLASDFYGSTYGSLKLGIMDNCHIFWMYVGSNIGGAEVTLLGWVCLSPRSKRRLFLQLPGVWSRTFAMRSPLRVESFSSLDRNENSSRTFPSVLVPGLRNGVALIGSSCVFLRTRSERRHVQSTYPRLLRDGVTLRVECGLSSHSIETKFSLDSWSVFLQDGSPFSGQVLATWSRVKEFLELGSWEHFFRAILGMSLVILWSTGMLWSRGVSLIQMSSLLAWTLFVPLSPTKE